MPSATDPGMTLCSVHFDWGVGSWIESQTSAGSSANLRPDAQGNVYYVGTFAGTVDLGFGAITSHGQQDGFVMKLSPRCTPIWLRQFGGTPATLVSMNVIAVDHEGSLIVGGGLVGTADFGAGELTTEGPDDVHNGIAVVWKLDPDGSLVWNRVLQSGFTATQIVDIAVGDSGDIVFSGVGDGGLHFAGTAQPEGPLYSGTYVAFLSAAGVPGPVEQIGGEGSLGKVAVDANGRVAFSGWAFGAHASGALGAFDWGSAEVDHFLLMLDPGGGLLWGRHLAPFRTADWSGIFGAAFDFDSTGDLVMQDGGWQELGDGSVQFDPQVIRKIDASGSDVWTRSSQYAGPSKIEWFGDLAFDSQDNIVHVDEVAASDTLDGEHFDVRGGDDLLVRKRDPDGELLWSRQLGADGAELEWGLATDKDDAVWVGYMESAVDVSEGTFTVEKLAP